MISHPSPTQVTLRLTKLPDPDDNRQRFPLRHDYVEIVYMPLIGATAVALLRRIGLLLAQDGDTIEVDPVALARELGLRSGSSGKLGDRSPLMNALGRLSRQNLIIRPTRWHIGVYDRVPALDERDLRRLPEPVRRVHHRHLRSTGRTAD